ncbi:MAG: SMP-30/gluconolactonase/LRE family protein [Burkholderiaceae bacterium]|nr:SMP-30/gluconolactonase/LRE family protein [Burkholderiaceae bacterium]
MIETPSSAAPLSHERPAAPGPPGAAAAGATPVGLDALREIGNGLSRPECVLCAASGSVYVPQWGETGGVCEIAPDGRQRVYAGQAPDGRELRANGIALRAVASLGARETVTRFGPGTFPDGLCFDAEGQAWVTRIVSNRVIRVAPDGARRVMLEDSEPEHLSFVEAAYQAATMGRVHLDQARSRRLRNIARLAVGGPGLRPAYMGCLLGSTLMAFDAPAAGHPPAHWSWG